MSSLPRLLIVALIAIAVIALRFYGADELLTMERIDELLEICRDFPPILYILTMTTVPVVFLPGFPFVIIGGLLYGHTMGLLYAMTGATLGASLAFLLSRYVAYGWINRRFTSGKWDSLQNNIQKNGWKVVLFLRLVPLFPYTPLNYALGITSISFKHYIIATFIGIFPACAAFIFFSTSFWDLLHSGSATNLFLAISLILLIFLVSLMLKKGDFFKTT